MKTEQVLSGLRGRAEEQIKGWRGGGTLHVSHTRTPLETHTHTQSEAAMAIG